MRKFINLFLLIFTSIIGWLIIAPIAILTPKNSKWIAVIGRQDGKFLDNAKYFFLHAGQIAPDLRIVFITERDDVFKYLKNSSREAIYYPSINSIYFLMRCSVVVVDEAAWFRKFRFFLLLRAKTIQIWHGIPFKWIELGLWIHENGKMAWASHPIVVFFRLLIYRITGRRSKYSAVVGTSIFYHHEVFSRFFLSENYPIIGYPRNDFSLSLHGENKKLAWINIDKTIKNKLPEWIASREKLVLITPTFRDSGSKPMRIDDEIRNKLNTFAELNKVKFIFKFHPSEKNLNFICGDNLYECNRDSDIYPLFPYAAALVTDYSSISMDFLLVDKPLLFLIPDGDDYVEKDRQLQFDPRTMMPGPVVPDWASLLQALLTEWADDTHADERAELRRKAFDDLPQGEAVPKLIALMRKEGWISSDKELSCEATAN